MEKSLRLASNLSAVNVLVIGAGHDPYREYFKSERMYTCLDVVAYKGVTDVLADAHQMPLKKESYDCIVAVEVMEHIKNPFVFIREVSDTLQPGGVLIVSVPFMYHFHADPFDFWRPTKMSIQYLLKDYSDIKVYSQGNRWHVISDLISTSFSPLPVFFPLRILNHLFCFGPFGSIKLNGKTTSPSGYVIVAKK